MRRNRRGGTRRQAGGVCVLLAGLLSMSGSAEATIPNAPGDVRWASTEDARAESADEIATVVATAPDGATIFVCAAVWSEGLGGRDIVTIAYDATTGVRAWAATYEGAAGEHDWPTAVAVSPDGSMAFVLGSTRGSNTDDDFVTIAYDARTGAVAWERRFEGPIDDDPASVAASPDGSKVFVTGEVGDPVTHGDYLTIAYDSLSGAVRWLRRYDGPGADKDSPAAVRVGPDASEVFVTGSSGVPAMGSDDFATVAYDAATGATQWVRRYDGPGSDNDDASSLVAGADGSTVFVTGSSVGTAGGADYATVAYEASTGDVRWARRYDGPDHIDDAPASVAASPDGSAVFVTGSSGDEQTRNDFVTVAYEASTGESLWTRRYVQGGKDDMARGIVVSPDGTSVFVGGTSEFTRTNSDFATVAYDAATGVTEWVRRYSGPDTSNDDATAIAMGPDGAALYVSGTTGKVDQYRMLTISYEA